jgi:integrase
MASATFVLKEPKSEDKTLVYLIFRYYNKRFKYSTGLQIKPTFWNIKSQRAKETKQFLEHSEFNTRLKIIESSITNTYRKLINDNITPTPDRLRTELNSVLLKSAMVKKNDLISFAETIIKTSVKRPNTIKHYRQTLRILIEFKLSFSRSLTFENIDLGFYDEFLKYCLDENYQTNTIGGFIKNVKVFMSEAVDRKLTNNLEFRNRRFAVLEEDTENIYLSQKDIDLLYALDLKDNPRLDKVRDLFIVGCYTGLRFSDLMQLDDQNLIDDRTKLKIKTEKTSEVVIIPLHKYIREILKKHNGVPQYLISNQKMNDYLKELGEQAELDEKILISFTKGGVKQSTNFKKYELITVHTARRSFATNAYLMDIPSISIMKITGHRSEKAFLKYIKISQEDNANKLLNHPFFN